MVCPTLISVDQFLHFPTSQVGTLGAVFGTLFSEGIPVPPMVVVPQETMLRLARESRLAEDLEDAKSWYDPHDPVSKHKLKNLLQRKITSQFLPDWFTQEIIGVYHGDFHNSFVKLTLSEQLFGHDDSNYTHVYGEANLVESFLELWAHSVELKLLKGEQPHQSWLAPSPILLQAQYQPVVSGIAFTNNPAQGLKNQVLLKAIWGAPDTALLEENSDSFAVDIRTWHIVHRDLATKTKQFQRESDGRVSREVPAKYYLHATLTDEQAAAIAQVVFAIKQKRLNQQLVGWELTRQGLFITNIKEITDPTSHQHHLKKTITKLYISTGNPYKHTPHLTKEMDGVGVLRSEYTYAKFGVHPLHAIRSRQKHLLQRELVKTITAYQAALPFKPIVYRSQNFTSSELRQLQHSESYAPKETNPYIGFRGCIQLVRQPELLNFELDVLKEVLKTSKSPIGYMLPFVRGAQELEFILSEIEKMGLFTYSQFGVWLQLNTPENVLNIRSYPVHKLAGVSLNVRSLHALLLGIDPDNSEIHEHYTMENLGLLKLMEQLAQSITDLQELRESGTPLQLNLHLEEFSHELVAQAVKLGYHGVIVKPAATAIAHSCIVEVEQSRLAHSV